MNKKLFGALLVCGLVFTGCQQKETEKKDANTQQAAKEDDHGNVEWIGEYEFEAGKEYGLAFDKSQDKSILVSFISLENEIAELDHHAAHVLGSKPEEIKMDNHDIDVKVDYAYRLELKDGAVHYHIKVPKSGKYAIALEHLPKEVNFKVETEDGKDVPIIKEQTIANDHNH